MGRLPERQAIVVVTKNGKVIEVFRNPVNSPSGCWT